MIETDMLAELYRLRFVEKKTLQEIANIYNKSIYWVNSRLNKKYTPSKTRKTIKDIELINRTITDENKISDEYREVVKLRREGLTYEEIASRLNRSIYWVHSRIQGEYAPKGINAGKIFQEERVVPFYANQGHTGILQYVRTARSGIVQEADIISLYEDRQIITEVKISIDHHQLQTAIGQLLIHKFTYSPDAKLQIALPKEVNRRKIPDELLVHLKKNDVYIIFVP